MFFDSLERPWSQLSKSSRNIEASWSLGLKDETCREKCHFFDFHTTPKVAFFFQKMKFKNKIWHFFLFPVFPFFSRFPNVSFHSNCDRRSQQWRGDFLRRGFPPTASIVARSVEIPPLYLCHGAGEFPHALYATAAGESPHARYATTTGGIHPRPLCHGIGEFPHAHYLCHGAVKFPHCIYAQIHEGRFPQVKKRFSNI